MPLRPDRPPYLKVRAEYARGASWTQLGTKYNLDPRSLYGYTKRDAARVGDAWPIKRLPVRGAVYILDAYGRCPALGVRMELRDFREWSGVRYNDVASEAGLNKTTIHKITSGVKQTIAVETRDKIMAVIMKHERQHGRGSAA